MFFVQCKTCHPVVINECIYSSPRNSNQCSRALSHFAVVAVTSCSLRLFPKNYNRHMRDFSHPRQQNGKFTSNMMFASVLLSSTCSFISIPEGKMLPNLVFLRKFPEEIGQMATVCLWPLRSEDENECILRLQKFRERKMPRLGDVTAKLLLFSFSLHCTSRADLNKSLSNTVSGTYVDFFSVFRRCIQTIFLIIF